MARQKRDDAPTQRYRFSVYGNNTAVLKWIDMQYNLSASLASIILDAIQAYGYKDVMANDFKDVGKAAKRGRPPKSDTEDETLDNSSFDLDKFAELVAQKLAGRALAKQREGQAAERPPARNNTSGVSPTASAAASFFGD